MRILRFLAASVVYLGFIIAALLAVLVCGAVLAFLSALDFFAADWKRTKEIWKPRLKSAKLWLWKHGGDRAYRQGLWFYGHWAHWQERHKWINERGAIQVLQRGMAILSLGIGLIFVVTGNMKSGSPVMDTLDILLARELGYALHFCHVPFFAPHQVFGAFLTVSSVLLGIAIYEWPLDIDAEKSERAPSPESREIDDARLRKLLRMHLIGHFVGMIYWAFYVVLTVPHWQEHPTSIWFGLALSETHRQMYLRVNREFIRETAKIERVRRGVSAKRRRTDTPSDHGAGLRETAGLRDNGETLPLSVV